ncbi:MAG: hypothetical protein IKD50_05075 [Clostridia bacterium]|nr:hypothetical protein [Clostridia bacterium]
MTETAQTNGTKENTEMKEESFVRKYIWCFLLLCLVAFGSFLVCFEYQQQPINAIILNVGQITKTSHRSRHSSRVKNYTTYHTTLTVLYDEDGVVKKDDVRYSYRNYWFPPKTGQEIQITTGLLGKKVQYPEDNLEMAGWIIIIFGGIFLAFAIRIAMVSGKENPYLTDHGNIDSATLPGAPGLEIRKVQRLPNGTYSWTCEVDTAYENSAYKITMLSCGGICAFMLIMVLILTRDMESLLIVTGCSAFVMLLAFGLSKLMYSGPGHLQVPYEMTDRGIKIGSGRSSRYVSYKSVRQVEKTAKKLRLHTRFGSPVVFIPEEDFEVISGYILRRIEEESREYRS